MITREQAIQLRHGDELHVNPCVIHAGPRGGEKLKQERWRVNGVVKLWKTRPTHFRVPIKWGLKVCAYLDHNNAHLFHLATECTPLRKTHIIEEKSDA